MSTKAFMTLIGAVVALVVSFNTFYVIAEYEKGVVLRFGRLVNTDIAPGLGVKVPFADEVRRFDGRLLTLDAQPESFFTNQNKRLIVDSFAKWRIANVETYYKTTGGDEAVANARLATRIANGLRDQFGRRTLHEVVSGERDQLMHELTESLNKVALHDVGVEVVDIRVKRIDLPTDVSGSVFDRMAAGREKEAREHRSQGKEQAEVIRADADRQRTILEANAYSKSEQIRGEGDATAAAIYANAYNRDPEFYAFVRSLAAYKQTFKGKDDVMLVDPKSAYFRYLGDSKGKK